MRRLAARIIWLYQKTLSGDHGLLKPLFPHGVCRFYPSCSEYARLAVLRYGAIHGFLKGLRRLLRCHPWGGSGHDPLK